MIDLIERLRDAFQRARYGGGGDYNPDGDLYDAAADRIEALEAKLAVAREALNHIDALCPVNTGGCTHAALAGLLYNIEVHAVQALKEIEQ